MKTIAIDCRFASTLSGLGRYTRELTTCLVERATDLQYVLLVRSESETWIPKAHSGVHIVQADIPHYSIAEQMVLPSIIRLSGADLLFSPHFNVPLSCPIPSVVTIHDLILHRYPNEASFIKKMAYRTLMKHVITKASAMCTVSDFVRTEIVDAYGPATASKISVIREGVSDLYRPSSDILKEHVRKKYDVRRPFFLYVGNAKEHKNVQTLLDAFQNSGNSTHDFVLLTGGKEVSRFQKIPSGVRRLSNIPDADLPVFYSLAEALFTATLYEGYCLPVAEAMACGCPVVASDLPVIREIANGHALFIDPTVENFAEAMCCNTYRHSEPFVVGTWEKTAEETEALLRNVLERL